MESTYLLSTSTNFDDVKLAEISLQSFENNPLVYLTYPKGVSREVVNFHHKSHIQFTKEEEVELIKVVANHLPGKPTVAFGIVVYGPKPPKKELRLPVDADFRFLNKLQEQTKLHTEKFYRKNEDIVLHLTCVLQEHRREGLGWMIRKYVLNQAEQRQKRVFLQATPEGRPLYLKLGFGLKAEASVDLKEFGKEGTYVQSTMIWDPSQRGDVDLDGV